MYLGDPLVVKLKKYNILKLLRKVFVILSVLVLLTITTHDRSELRKQRYYQETKERLSSWHPSKKRSTPLKAGWAKANIVPPFEVNVIGYHKNDPYTGIHDSLLVRTMIFEQDSLRIAVVSFDLMMVHPQITKAVWRAVKKNDLSIDHIYFTCTHTHNGFGGFAPGIASKVILGGYRADVVNWLGSQTANALKTSLEKLQVATLASVQIDQSAMVANRLDPEKGTIDPWFRIVKVTTQDQQTALLHTFSAHPTILDRKGLKLSGDYPGELNRQIEAKGIADFSLFCAGGVGSHKPVVREHTYDQMKEYASLLVDSVERALPRAQVLDTRFLDYDELEVSMRSPHLKLSPSFRIRPWLFYMIIGKMHPKLTYFRLGALVFLGAPCDFSGELSREIQKGIRDDRVQLMVTSFNGEYIGYITKDLYYDDDRFEVRDMNWFGPTNGAYFTELMTEMVNRKSGKN